MLNEMAGTRLLTGLLWVSHEAEDAGWSRPRRRRARGRETPVETDSSEQAKENPMTIKQESVSLEDAQRVITAGGSGEQDERVAGVAAAAS